MIIKSMEFVQLIVKIEEKYNIEVPDEFMNMSKYNTFVVFENYTKNEKDILNLDA